MPDRYVTAEQTSSSVSAEKMLRKIVPETPSGFPKSQFTRLMGWAA
jgi:hypothetical protein